MPRRNVGKLARSVLALCTALGVQGCLCKAYVQVTLAGNSEDGGARIVMVGDTLPLVAQAQKYLGDGGCWDAGEILGPGSTARPSEYRWTSSMPTVAKAQPDGRVVALMPGETTIHVRYMKDEAETDVAVQVIPRIARITVEPRLDTIFVGDTVSFLIGELTAQGNMLPPRYPGVIDPHLREVGAAGITGNMVRTNPQRVLLRGERVGTARLRVWSSTYRYERIPQDTATLVVLPR